ncbi:uncharacterized protein LOC128202750 isoform X3 [Mya arenaria]|uniref:uncharacterized protein LOC128202750 isoform X3 n=1 Tax=Mya arenaria TaxID=6604 RepID=UPI0022DFD038|nr:uncharacterized protein LOC128202750 isoform X3 [Mya arenaria]
MAAYRTFVSPESQNWLKQWRAVFITRRAVLPFVESKSSNLHYDIVQKASNEQTCSLDHGRLSDRQQIPCRFHEKLRNEIKVIHKRKKPSWGNASTDTWGDSPFAVAKLFMQPAGYDDKSSFDEIDFNGLAAFIYNCGKYTPTLETLFDEARMYVNKIRHMPDACSSALTDQATTECIDSMLALLNDPEFQGDPEIQEASKQLDELAAYRTFFGQESQNWLKQWFAVFITRRAVLPFVESKSSNLHYDIVQKASNEQTCSLDHGRLSDRQQIPCRFHEKLRNEIKVIHKRKKPSWGNASTDTWGDSPFAVAKLFMQPAGYDDKSSFDEIDFNGLAAFIYNCGKYTPTLETLSDEARKYVNNIRNIPDLCSSALTDQATTECIDSMLALLNDPEFQGDPEILEAMEQLDEDERLSILTDVTLENMTMSAGVFRRLVSILIQSGHSVNCELSTCTIEPEENVTQLQVEMENQPAFQMDALHPVLAAYTTNIRLDCMLMSAGAFISLVSIVMQSGHSVNCTLSYCTIEPEENVRQLQVEMENQPAHQMVALKPVSAAYTTHFTFNTVIMSAGVFRCLVSIVIQSGYSVNFHLENCTIEPEGDVRQLQVEVENQPALQMVALQPASTDYTTHITFNKVTMSAGVFRRLVSIVIQSDNSVICELSTCTIDPEEDVRQLQVEMENLPAVKLVTPFHLAFPNIWVIEFNVNVKGKRKLPYLVSF